MKSLANSKFDSWVGKKGCFFMSTTSLTQSIIVSNFDIFSISWCNVHVSCWKPWLLYPYANLKIFLYQQDILFAQISSLLFSISLWGLCILSLSLVNLETFGIFLVSPVLVSTGNYASTFLWQGRCRCLLFLQNHLSFHFWICS